jgi:multiple sugar transport system substrate-binding protein/sn-glycerol 3-phosphate transport system substrate-binding protein
LLAACQPAPAPTRRPGEASPTVDGNSQSDRTRTPTPDRKVTSTPTPLPVSAIDVKPADLDGTTIEYWHAWNGEAGRLAEELVEEFNASNEWGIKVQASSLGDYKTLAEQVNQAVSDRKPPDVVAAYDYQALEWDDRLVEISEYVDDPVWGWSATDQADFYPPFWEQPAGIETRLSLPAQRSGQVLFYNATWAKELGFRSPPGNLEQFQEQACAAAQANLGDDVAANDGTGGWIISTDYPAVLGWLYASGSQLTRPNGSGYRFDTPQVKEALSFLRELYEQDCAWLPENQTVENEFASRLGLFATGNITDIPYQQAAFDELGNRDEWTVLPFPSGNDEAAIAVYGPSFTILESTPEEQLGSWLFIQWLLSAGNQARWVQVSDTFPLRLSVLDNLAADNPQAEQWIAAVNLLEYAHPEPGYRSWETVRFAVSDVATQLFRWYFTLDQLPSTVRLLERTASELHQRFP